MLQRIRKRLAQQRQTSETTWTPHMSALLAIALIFASFAALIDEWSIILIQQSASPIVGFFEAITDIALARWYFYPALFLMLGVGLVLWLISRSRSRHSRMTRLYLWLVFNQTLFVSATILCVNWMVDILKIVFGRSRPELMELAGPYNFRFFEFDNLHWSFPSGHAATAGVITIILILWFPRARYLALLFGAVLAFSRVVLEKHYPSDVIVGFTIGALVTILLARWLASHALLFRHRSGQLIPVMHWPHSRQTADENHSKGRHHDGTAWDFPNPPSRTQPPDRHSARGASVRRHSGHAGGSPV